MSLRTLLEGLLLWGIYPLWLLAGAGDYVCHRRTDIEHTSGNPESRYHLLQYLTLLVVFAAAVLLKVNAVIFGAMVILIVVHSVLAHLDVSYTDGRRYISPLEQQIHGFMEVLPVVAVAIFGVLHWAEIGAGLTSPILALETPVSSGRALLLASFAVLAGVPVLEELVRTRRHRSDRERRYHEGLATIK
ncbi:hypothetical protein [Steroidobacter gossypii]|nr:hypothetical protein [Steroidobacter gossypii]